MGHFSGIPPYPLTLRNAVPSVIGQNSMMTRFSPAPTHTERARVARTVGARVGSGRVWPSGTPDERDRLWRLQRQRAVSIFEQD